MKLKEIVEKLNLETRGKINKLDNDVNRGYISDLLSDVIANGKKNDLWITLQIHQNIVAVACMKELSGIVVINGREPDEETIKKADNENIPIMVSKMTAFELAGRLYAMGIHGMNNEVKGV